MWRMRSLIAFLMISAGVRAAAEPPRLFHLPLRGRVDMDFMWIPPGRFPMGDPAGDADEQPVHEVSIRNGFWMGRHETTQRQYESVMATNPSTFRGPDLPVDSVSYRDIQNFLAKLPQRSGLPSDLQARLPTEAEWEYACRGGSAAPTPARLDSTGLAVVAWFADNSGLRTQPVGQKAPNGFGLYDMLGNVWEWCGDAYLERYYTMVDDGHDPKGPQVGSTRVLRGGSWRNTADYCRPANRFHYRMWSRDHTAGFRLVLVPK